MDLNFSSNFISALRSEGIEITYTAPSNFSEYKTSGFIVILGGPDAPEDVGEIIREVLMNSKQNAVRENGAKKMYIKTNVWATGQKVIVLAGSGRDQTKESHQENREQVATKAYT